MRYQVSEHEKAAIVGEPAHVRDVGGAWLREADGVSDSGCVELGAKFAGSALLRLCVLAAGACSTKISDALRDAYAEIVRKQLTKLGVKVMFEPGRLIVGNAGILVSEVIFVKEGDAKNFLVVDAAMNDLIRPTLYDAFHDIKPVVQPPADTPRMAVDVVGPVCETGDYLGLDRDLPKLKSGDLIAVSTAGAYGAVQSGTYNTRLLVPEVLVDGDRFHVVRQRQTYDELIGLDSVPDWLK